MKTKSKKKVRKVLQKKVLPVDFSLNRSTKAKRRFAFISLNNSPIGGALNNLQIVSNAY